MIVSPAFNKQTPPPSTTPSLIATLEALRASSIRSFLSFNSTSVGAPTSITATPPASLASLSFNLTLVLVGSAWILALRSSTLSSTPGALAFLTIVQVSLVTITLLAVPKKARSLTSLILTPSCSETSCVPVITAMSSKAFVLYSPNSGALTATTFNIPLNVFTTKVASNSP